MMRNKKMTERELTAHIDQAERNSITESGSFTQMNEGYLKRYKAELYGDEVDGKSKVVSTDVRDLVESDMPSLARVFLGAGDPVEFRAPLSNDKLAVQEAKDKQALVGHIISTAKNSFRAQHDWLKSSEFQTMAALEYGVEDQESTQTKRYRGLSEDELAVYMTEFEADSDVSKVEIEEQDQGEDPSTYDVTFRITHTKQVYFLRNIPIEDLIISRNAWSKDDADIVGKRFTKTRSQLVSEGFSKEQVDSLPASKSKDDESALKSVRYRTQGGEEEESPINSWANEEVSGIDCYIKVDFDGDGIAERRHVISVGHVVLVNENFNHVPYAIISSMLMPNNINGIPRAELTMEYQKTNTVIRRQILDNLYAHNNPRSVVSDNVELDDMLDIRLNGIVRTSGVPQQDVMPLVVPYIGDKALQVITYLNQERAQSTGTLQQNQALEADQLQKETATRFEGMQDAATAKIELVARVIAETGYRDLWEGIAWFASHYQDTDMEMRVLGREAIVNPANWKHDHHISALVGTGAGDDEKTLANLSTLYQFQTQLMGEGSTLADDMKRYNILAAMTKTIGRDVVSDYFNNPEQPEQVVFAENEILKRTMQSMEQQMQNPLAEAEQVKAQAQLQMQQMEQKFNAQLEQFKQQAKAEEELRKQQAKYQTDLQDLQFKYAQLAAKTGFDYTKLEVENNTDVPGEGMGQ